MLLSTIRIGATHMTLVDLLVLVLVVVLILAVARRI